MNALRKCLVWDLDNTLWDGVCLEGAVRLRPEAAEAIRELDRRGIVHSIASRGEADIAVRTLEGFGLQNYFIEPQVNWLPKSQSIRHIAGALKLPLDAMAFIDDDPFEREQIAFMLPEVLSLDAQLARTLAERPEFSPVEVTSEARDRRRMYQAEAERSKAEAAYPDRETFLRSCAMRLTVRPMRREDIPRVHELMTRTHQLNTTGIVFERSDVERMLSSDGGPGVTVAELEDRFGSSGIIGAAIAEVHPPVWRLSYLAISCRVMGRGIERALLSTIVRCSAASGCATAEALYRDTGRNRMMRTLYQMMNFRAGARTEDGTLVLTTRCADVPGVPSWVEVA